ncbi:MAG: phage tail terminator-like protein [Methylobacter sp.]
MSIISVRAALETALNAMTPSLSTCWENTPHTAVAGTPYQQVYLLVAEPENPTMGDGFYREQGILQITLMYPLQTGSATAAARAELIRTTFKRGTSFTSGAVTVRINRTPEISPGRVDGDRFAVPVKIRWFSDKLT